MILVEILMALLFILSSGLLFHERFKNSKVLITITGLIALVGTYFLFEQITGRMIQAEIDRRFGQPSTAAVPQPATLVPPDSGVAAAPAPGPSPGPVTASITRGEVESVFRDYVAAWQAGNVSAQANLLDASFSYIDQQNVRQGRESYVRQKSELAKRYGASIRIGVANVAVETRGEFGSVSYDQTYDSPYYSSFGRNKFVMRKRGNVVRIVEEVFDRKRFERRDPRSVAGAGL